MQTEIEKKTKLEKTVESATKAIENQFNTYKSQGKNIAIISSIIIGAYAVSKFLGDDEPKEKDKGTFLGSAIAGIAASVLLEIAKTKLIEYLENLENDKNI